MKKHFWLISVSGVIFTASPALAQDAPTEEDTAIVVTATKRSASLQDVPIAVSAYSADDLKKAGVTDVTSLQSIAPSLTVSSSASDSLGTEFRVRGVGTVGINPGLESAVATYIDGVYRNRSNVSPADLPGIERIELLRGPQGTLFGKNTSAGVVSIVTALPSFTPGVEAEATYGKYNLFTGQLALTGPIAGGVAARIDGAFARADGWVRDAVVDRRYKNKDRASVRGQLLFEPAADLSIRLIADYAKRDETGYSPDFYRVLGPTSPALRALGAVLVTGADDLRNTKTYDQGETVEEVGASLQLDWKTGIGTLTAITAWRGWEHRVKDRVDIDHNNLDLIYVDHAYEKFDTFTQELRLSGTTGGLDYLIGGFYARENLDVLSQYKIGSTLEPYVGLLVGGSTVLQGALGLPAGSIYPAGGGSNGDLWKQESETIAIFTHNTINFTEALSLTAGLRYSRETKSLDARLPPVTSPACQAFLARGLIAVPAAAGLYPVTCIANFDPRFNGDYSGRHAEDQWSGTLSMNYKLAQSVNSYASYSRGTKSGGFNLDRAGFRDPFAAGAPETSQLEFDPEKVDAFELGLKVRVPGAGLQINTAIFYSKFRDFQVTYNTGAGLVTTNVPKVTTKGFEVESSWAPDRHIDLALAVTHSVAEYGAITNINPTITALSGLTLPNAPRWTLTGSAGYRGSVGNNLNWFVYADARWQSRQQTDALGAAEGFQSAYATLGARVGLGQADGHWAIELWTRNLTDKRAFQYSSAALFQPGSFVGIVNEPRTFGITARSKF